MIEVPDDYEGRAYCSFECAVYAGAYSMKDGWLSEQKNNEKAS